MKRGLRRAGLLLVVVGVLGTPLWLYFGGFLSAIAAPAVTTGLVLLVVSLVVDG
jgi:hypothetical protein